MKSKFAQRVLGIFSALAGLSLLAFVALPILSYTVPQATKFDHYLSPVPKSAEAFDTSVVDYTKASNWFSDDKSSDNFSLSNVRYYTLSIPSMGIEDATVAIGGEDLSDSLIQYPGTALPGKRGNAVIFGHSILPQFYNPKDYLAIFSKLPTIEKGAEVFISYDGIEYEYLVEDVFEVKPTDLEILAQNTSDSFTTLVTCTPPGHPLRPKRLIVRARLNPYSSLSSRN